MGRSPGRWIKTVLFGKKSSKSHASKGKDASKSVSDKEYVGGKGQSSPAVTSPVISQPVLINKRNGGTTESEKGTNSNLGIGEVTPPINQEVEHQRIIETDVSNDSEKVKEERAAVKMQAALRGFLSRRAFHALKGIIRLQALVRGHLVRRQAVATLYSLQGIVKLQALVRGQRVRLSGISHEVATKYHRGKDMDGKQSDSWKERMLANAYIHMLLSALPVAMPLQVQYGQGEPNSVLSWQERWTLSQFWKPLPQPKKATGTRSQARRSNSALESETGRPKRSVHRNSAASVDSAPANIVMEPERPKRNLRKVPSTPADSMQEHPQTELEKVKRNLRKVSNSTTETCDRSEVESEKPACSLKKVSNFLSAVPHQDIRGSMENTKDVEATTESKPVTESASNLGASDGPNNAVIENDLTHELHSSQNTGKEDNLSLMNEELSLKDEQSCNESQKSSKRRASFSSKSEYHAENGQQNAPKLPSYMATTESAKAKLRGQVSPRFGSDSAGKNSITRRHSLPSSMNGKLSSQSPRTHKLIQACGKGGIRNDRSLSSSRDDKSTSARAT